MRITLYLSIGSLLLILSLFRGRLGIEDYWNLKASHRILTATVEDLSKENHQLNQEIELLTHHPAYARKILRDKYHYAEDHEHIVFFGDE